MAQHGLPIAADNVNMLTLFIARQKLAGYFFYNIGCLLNSFSRLKL